MELLGKFRKKKTEQPKAAKPVRSAPEKQAEPPKVTKPVGSPAPEKKTEPEKADAPVSGFDRQAFTVKYKSIFAPRLPQNIDEPQTQKELLQNLEQVIPGIRVAIISNRDLCFPEDGSGPKLSSVGLISIVSHLDGALGRADMDRAAAHWNDLPDEPLIDAFLLLSYYLFSLKPEAIGHVDATCALLADELEKRFSFAKQTPVSYIRSLDRVYVTFMRATGDKVPSMDKTGFAWLFSKKEYADACVRLNAGADMFVREFDQKGLDAFVRTWYRYGVTRFKLNPGTSDRCAEVERDDFLPIEGVKQWDVVGSALNQMIVRFRQYNAMQNNPDARAAAMTMWNAICHELYRSVFLVPIVFDGDPDSVSGDWAIHATKAAAERMTQFEFERQFGERLTDGNSLVAIGHDEKPVYSLRKESIIGSEKYHFAGEGESADGRVMHLRSIMGGGKSYLCAFTDLDALHALFGEDVRVSIQTYENIIARLSDRLTDNSELQGLVINPAFNELFLSRENVEVAAKEKDGPAKLYV